MRFDELSKGTQTILNTLESESLSIRTRLDLIIGTANDEAELRSKLLYLLDGPLKNLVSVAAELREPIVIIEEEAEHPCDNCAVVKENMEPEEVERHCAGCENEMRQVDWVHPKLRGYVEPTEASAEDDPEDY